MNCTKSLPHLVLRYSATWVCLGALVVGSTWWEPFLTLASSGGCYSFAASSCTHWVSCELLHRTRFILSSVSFWWSGYTTGGLEKRFTLYCQLAQLLSRHDSMTYSSTLAWLHYTLSFSLLRSATMLTWGNCSISLRYPDASPESCLVSSSGDY